MTHAIGGIVLTLSNSLAALIVAKVTLILALALAGVRLGYRSCAAVRHVFLAVAFGVLLMLPIGSLIAPPIRIAVAAIAPERSAPSAVVETVSSAASPNARIGSGSAVIGSPRTSLSSWLLAGWAIGALIFLLPVIGGLKQVRSIRRSASPGDKDNRWSMD